MARKRCKARVFPQLTGEATAGEDCGVRTTQRMVHWASCGRVLLPVKVIRHRMGKPTGPTNPGDWLKVLRHPDTVRQFRKAGLQAPRARLRGVGRRTGLIMGSPIKTALDALGDGHMVSVAESYTVWHDTRWSGSEIFGSDYRDDHAASYVGLAGKVGDRVSTRYDSIADGRRPGIATGPSVVPWHLAAEAMAKLELSPRNGTRDPLGAALWAGVVVQRALPLDDGGTVTPPTTCEAKLAKLQADYDALQTDYDLLDDAADDARTALAAIATSLDDAAATAKAAIDALDAATGATPETVEDAPVVSGVAVARAPADDEEDDS